MTALLLLPIVAVAIWLFGVAIYNNGLDNCPEPPLAEEAS